MYFVCKTHYSMMHIIRFLHVLEVYVILHVFQMSSFLMFKKYLRENCKKLIETSNLFSHCNSKFSIYFNLFFFCSNVMTEILVHGPMFFYSNFYNFSSVENNVLLIDTFFGSLLFCCERPNLT